MLPYNQFRKIISSANDTDDLWSLISEHSSSVLYAFDLDDTLVFSKRFEEHIKGLIEGKTPESMLRDALREIGKTTKDLHIDNGRVYLDDPTHRVHVSDGSTKWTRKKDRVYLLQPNEYFVTEYSLPTKANTPIVELYNRATNRCIITSRKENVRGKLSNEIKKLGLKEPNAGFFLVPMGSRELTYKFKASILKGLLDEFSLINYFDDNAKMIKRIRSEIPATANIVYYKVTGGAYKKVM